MLNSDARKLKVLLAVIDRDIKPLIDARSFYDSEVSSAESFEDFPEELQAKIKELAFFDAISEIDRRARNQYWFLRMLAVSLILARTVPIERDEVLAAAIRERKIYCATGDPVLLDKVMGGRWAELTDSEEAQAIEAGLLLQSLTGVRGTAPGINHVYSLA